MIRLVKITAFWSPSKTSLCVSFQKCLQHCETKLGPMIGHCFVLIPRRSVLTEVKQWGGYTQLSYLTFWWWYISSGSPEIFCSSRMSDRGPDEAVKQPRKKRKPARMPKSRRGRPAKYQYIWQLMADEARLAKMKNQSESVDGVVGAWTPATEEATKTEGATMMGATPRRLDSSSTTQMDSNSVPGRKCELDLFNRFKCKLTK